MSTLATTALKHASSSSNNIVLDSSGNVGIGTSSPAARLHISGSTIGNSNVRLTNIFAPGRTWELNPYLFGVDDSLFSIRDVTASANRLAINSSGYLQFDSGYGSVATAYGCRAWVNFNGTGAVAIRASGNVTSITDNGTGDYTVNFTTAMPDVSYTVTSTGEASALFMRTCDDLTARTTTALRVRAIASNFTLVDPTYAQFSIFR